MATWQCTEVLEIQVVLYVRENSDIKCIAAILLLFLFYDIKSFNTAVHSLNLTLCEMCSNVNLMSCLFTEFALHSE